MLNRIHFFVVVVVKAAKLSPRVLKTDNINISIL
jgi:hypothetical protein